MINKIGRDKNPKMLKASLGAHVTKETTPQLERALTLRDLVLFNLVAVIGIGWVATAAKAGPSALTLWLLAAILFFVPQGLAVIQLSSSFPAEGGIYAWTKKEFGEGHGFVCGWCYWINNVLFYPTLLLAGAVSATYIIGQGESGLANNWTYVLPFTLIALTLAVMLNVVGVDTGKWLQNIGGVSVYLPGIFLILLGLYAALTKAPANTLTLVQLKPDLTNLPLLNLWATIAFAFAGLELSSTMGHEIHNPRRNLPRSIYIAAPLIALIYVCGTGSMLWLVPKQEINIVAGPLQAIANGMRDHTLSYSGENRRTRRLADRVSARRLRGRTRSLFPGCFRARSSALAHALHRDPYSSADRRTLSRALRPGQRNDRGKGFSHAARHVVAHLLHPVHLPLHLFHSPLLEARNS